MRNDITTIARAAAMIREAQTLYLCTGAGMGVDSGLPDFRGPTGFWKAYPALRARGIRFEEMANPAWFHADPEFAWGFYGHRAALYRNTSPHRGFEILRGWFSSRQASSCFTSNVDGHLQRAGFDPDRIVECHGSIEFLQCQRPCTSELWPNEASIGFDEETLRATTALPVCARCGDVARPNILLFDDGHWIGERTAAQQVRLANAIEASAAQSSAIIEIGAGKAVPTVRWFAEALAAKLRAPLIRINPRDADGGTVCIEMGGLAALTAIDEAL